MRIGFDGKRATHNFRGLGNYSRTLIEGLIEYSPEMELILYSPPVYDKRAIDWIKKYQDQLSIKSPQNALFKLFPSVWRSYYLEKETRLDKLDIFHGLSHELPFFLNKKQTKWIVTMHDLIFLRYPHFFPYIDRQVYLQKFKHACAASDHIIAICEQTKRDLIEFLKIEESKIIVHYQSCHPSFYIPLKPDIIKNIQDKYHLPEKYILNVGAFEERKNQLSIVEAYAQIAKNYAHDLVFVGNGKKYLSEVKSRAFQLGILDRVHFFTKVSFLDLPAFYQLADLFVFPSFFEGFGIPIIEALFSGTPVLTSHGSCFPESAGPNSFFIDPHSIEEISIGIKNILSSASLQNKMKIEGLKYAERFHLKNSTHHLLDIYRQI